MSHPSSRSSSAQRQPPLGSQPQSQPQPQPQPQSQSHLQPPGPPRRQAASRSSSASYSASGARAAGGANGSSTALAHQSSSTSLAATAAASGGGGAGGAGAVGAGAGAGSASGSGGGAGGGARKDNTTFSQRLRHMFDTQRYAVFTATVLLEELGNVPQLEGQFAARWKFRGRRPKGRDAESGNRLGNKPSMPNLKFSTIHPSTSSLSVRTTSTNSSTPISSQTPIPSRQSSMPPSMALARGKSNTMPLSSLQPSAQLSATALPAKKGSDPTPLRQSVRPSPSPSPSPAASSAQVSSPEVVAEPSEDPELTSRGRGRTSIESGHSRDDSIAPSIRSKSQESKEHHHHLLNLLAGGHPHNQPYLHPNGQVRSGAQQSASMLVDPVPGKGDDIPTRPVHDASSRRASTMTASSSTLSSDAASSYASLPQIQPRPGPLVRKRSISAASSSGMAAAQPRTPLYSSSRKGTTPVARLKVHTCTWNYELNHMMRIPLTKPAPVAPTSGTASPRTPRPPLPILGAGPLSESGLRIVIEQLPTPSSTSGSSTSGANKDSAAGMVNAMHNLEKGLNSSETRKSSGPAGEKAVFGIVDVDLAAFAGKGRTTRRFLLRGSRTNATVKLTVDMRWVGGEEAWVAPPMQEGHHVTGITDLAGYETLDNFKNDLNLAKTPSNSSSGSSVQSPSNPSMASSLNLSRNVSSLSLPPVPSGPPLAYKSYEHHLRPPDLNPHPPQRRASRSSTPTTPDQESGYESPGATASAKLGSPANEHEPGGHGRARGTMSPLSSPRHKLYQHQHRHHHAHTHHTHHMRPHDRGIPRTSGMHELPPNVVIEHIFNPHPATEEGPFTYVPERRDETAELGGEQAVLDRVIETVLGREVVPEGSEPGTPTLEEDGDGTKAGAEARGAGHAQGREHSRWARVRARVGNGRAQRGERGAKIAAVGA